MIILSLNHGFSCPSLSWCQHQKAASDKVSQLNQLFCLNVMSLTWDRDASIPERFGWAKVSLCSAWQKSCALTCSHVLSRANVFLPASTLARITLCAPLMAPAPICNDSAHSVQSDRLYYTSCSNTFDYWSCCATGSCCTHSSSRCFPRTPLA